MRLVRESLLRHILKNPKKMKIEVVMLYFTNSLIVAFLKGKAHLFKALGENPTVFFTFKIIEECGILSYYFRKSIRHVPILYFFITISSGFSGLQFFWVQHNAPGYNSQYWLWRSKGRILQWLLSVNHASGQPPPWKIFQIPALSTA